MYFSEHFYMSVFAQSFNVSGVSGVAAWQYQINYSELEQSNHLIP